MNFLTFTLARNYVKFSYFDVHFCKLEPENVVLNPNRKSQHLIDGDRENKYHPLKPSDDFDADEKSKQTAAPLTIQRMVDFFYSDLSCCLNCET